jgi:hypothetical protein
VGQSPRHDLAVGVALVTQVPVAVGEGRTGLHQELVGVAAEQSRHPPPVGAVEEAGTG